MRATCITLTTATVVGAIVLTGCSGSSAGTAQHGESAPNVPAGLSSAVKAAAGAGGPLDVSKQCAAVSQPDVQKLFKATAPAVTVNPGECDWGGGALTVDIYSDDPTRKYLANLFAATAKPLSGVGDYAVWAQPVDGRTVPNVGCHNGSTTVTITAGLDVDKTTLTYTGTGPIFTVDPASAQIYAGEEGRICTDVFGVTG